MMLLEMSLSMWHLYAQQRGALGSRVASLRNGAMARWMLSLESSSMDSWKNFVRERCSAEANASKAQYAQVMVRLRQRILTNEIRHRLLFWQHVSLEGRRHGLAMLHAPVMHRRSMFQVGCTKWILVTRKNQRKRRISNTSLMRTIACILLALRRWLQWSASQRWAATCANSQFLHYNSAGAFMHALDVWLEICIRKKHPQKGVSRIFETEFRRKCKHAIGIMSRYAAWRLKKETV